MFAVWGIGDATISFHELWTSTKDGPSALKTTSDSVNIYSADAAISHLVLNPSYITN